MSLSYTLIFGLTADPIHKGHEQAIINAAQYFQHLKINIKEFIIIPVFQPNLIANKRGPVASFDQRLEMCKKVAKRLSHKLNLSIIASDIEKIIANSTGQNNYSLNTIKHLNMKNSLFMVSADHFQGRWPKFRKWFGWKEILEHSGLLINQRPGHKINSNFIEELLKINPAIYVLDDQKSVDTSSSKIRATFYKADMDYHLSEDIIEYINEQGLYINHFQ